MTEIIVDPNTHETWEFYIDKRLKVFLDRNVKIDLSKKDKDYVMLIDGYEGAGKSTFAQQVGRYVDPTLSLDRICMTAQEFREAIANAEKNSCVIYDEAVTGLTAGDSISRVGKLVKSMMMQMRQKNLLVIIILPSLFEMNKYTILSRAKCLFHIYENKGKRGFWVGYNRKDMRLTYLRGKKTYSYLVRSHFRGRFYGKYTIHEQPYRDKKEQALHESEELEVKDRFQVQRDKMIKMFYNMIKSQRKLAAALEEGGISLSQPQLSNILKGMQDKEGNDK